MACTCSSCARYTIAIISVFFFLISIGFFLGFVDMKDDQPWFKPIRNNCILYYLSLIAASFMIVYAILGFILCFAKEKILYVIYLLMILMLIILKIIIIILTLYNKNGILKTIEKNWYKQKYNKYRYEFEEDFKCCGFTTYDPKQKCGYVSQRFYLCGVFVEVALIQYLDQLRALSIYLILIEILPAILATVLTCCNDENKDENNENESNTSMYSTLLAE